MKRFIITEDEKKYIKSLYSLNEQIDYNKMIQQLIDYTKEKIAADNKGESSDSLTDFQNEFQTDSETIQSSDQIYINPKANSVTINYRPKAVKLNNEAELLLKSICAKAGLSSIEVTSTLRNYEDQARINYEQTSGENIRTWYGQEVYDTWKKFKEEGKSTADYAKYLKDRDQKRSGKVISNHVRNLSIDVVPYNEKLATTADEIKKQIPNSGIGKVVREKNNGINGAIHFDFTFPVTGNSNIKVKEIKKDTINSEEGLIFDKNNSSNEFSIVFGGSPSSRHGAKFMYNIGKPILNDKNIVYSNYENSYESILNKLKEKYPNVKIKSVNGFSAGGKNAWDAIDKVPYVGLIDPIVTNKTYSILGDQLDKKLPSNVKMISRSDNWSGNFIKHNNLLKKIESNNPEIYINKSHNDMPAYFFNNFKKNI